MCPLSKCDRLRWVSRPPLHSLHACDVVLCEPPRCGLGVVYRSAAQAWRGVPGRAAPRSALPMVAVGSWCRASADPSHPSSAVALDHKRNDGTRKSEAPQRHARQHGGCGGKRRTVRRDTALHAQCECCPEALLFWKGST